MYGEKKKLVTMGFHLRLGSCHPAVTSEATCASPCRPADRQIGTKRYLCLAGLRLFSFDLEHIRALTETRLLRVPRATSSPSPEPHEHDRGRLG